MTSPSTPDRMEWKHDGYTLILDEDGLHLRTGRNAFEQPEVLAIIANYQAVQRTIGHGFEAPKPPTQDEIRAMTYAAQHRRAKAELIRTLQAELAADATNPLF